MHPGSRRTCFLFLLGSVCATTAQDASASAFVQTEYRVHQALAVAAGEKVVERLVKDAVVFKYVQDFANVEIRAYQLLFQYASAAMRKDVPQAPAFTPPLLGAESDEISSQDHGPVVAGLLEALGNDDFVRNVTYAAAEMEGLAKWFNETAEGHMDLYLETMPNSTSEQGFAAEIDRFLRQWSLLELEFLQQLTSISTGFAESIPASLLKEEVKTQLKDALANVSALVTQVANTTLSNTSGVDGENFCSVMMTRMVHDSKLLFLTDSILGLVNASKSMLPVLGEAFMKAEALTQPENTSTPTTPPRFALVMGVALDSTSIFVRSLRDHRKLLASKFTPLLEQYMDCDVEDFELQQSEPPTATEAPIAAALVSPAALQRSAAVSPSCSVATLTCLAATLLAVAVPLRSF